MIQVRLLKVRKKLWQAEKQTKVVLIRLGIYLFVLQIKRGWEPQIFYSYFVLSQLYETMILIYETR